MVTWSRLRAELTHWERSGESASFWWRDDDATDATEALESLLSLTSQGAVPLCLAVIPADASPALGCRLAGMPGVTVLQHGWSHRNFARPGDKACELASNRPINEISSDLGRGRRRLREMFGPRVGRTLVPPWNRIAPSLVARLPELGFHVLSTFAPRRTAQPAPGLRQVNCHVDLIDWRGRRGFVGEGRMVEDIVKHLHRRRTRRVDRSEPTGILTHHLVHDGAGWAFLAALVEFLSGHPAACWVNPMTPGTVP